jgi:hypothetical protein
MWPMKPLFDSFWRAVAYCLHPRVIALSLLPLLVTGVLTLGLSYLFWEPALAAVRSALESWSLVNSMLQWMSQMFGSGFRTVFTQMIVVALSIPIIVAVVLILVGLWTTPAAVAMVARRRFANLERRHGGAWWKGALLSLAYTVAALFMVLVTLPLWLVPGLALLLPPLIWGWLAAKVMGFDALAEHASAQEREAIVRAHRWPMLVIGILTGFLCGIPSLVWTLSPSLLILAPLVVIVCIWLYTMIFTFSALWFTHYALTELERLRAAEIRMAAVQPAMAAQRALPIVDEVPPHERRGAVDGTDPADPLSGPLP